jgi:hypothetical protein
LQLKPAVNAAAAGGATLLRYVKQLLVLAVLQLRLAHAFVSGGQYAGARRAVYA